MRLRRQLIILPIPTVDFRVARAVRSNVESVLINISFPVYNDVYKIMPTGKVTRDIESGSVTERTHVCSSEGARLPRCVDGR